jgi:hypothetical protein
MMMIFADISKMPTLPMLEWHPTSTHAFCKENQEREEQTSHLKVFD